MNDIRVFVRWMINRDLPEVLAIENASFTYPWPEEEFRRCLNQRNCFGMIAEHENRVLGFMIYQLYRDGIYLIDFAVATEYRRRYVGCQMVATLASKLSSHTRNLIALEVSETNLVAQVFFRNAFKRARLELVESSISPDFYNDPPDNAYSMIFKCHGEYKPARLSIIGQSADDPIDIELDDSSAEQTFTPPREGCDLYVEWSPKEGLCNNEEDDLNGLFDP
jgi:ribosomal-protein-alanine N-acetyltransferase